MSLINVPNEGARIIPNLATPDNPIIPFIEGDGIGADITPVMMKVVDAAVSKAYGGGRKIHWMEVFCGEKASRLYGEPLPQETLDALKECVVSIRGPLDSPADSAYPLDAQLRQQLDLYASARPVRWFQGVPSPVKSPDLVSMVIFRDSSEDLNSNIELDTDSEAVQKLMAFLQGEMGVKKVRFPGTTSIGIKQVSREGTEQLVRKAIQYAIDHHHKSVTLVHKGNVMRPTESLFRSWGFELAKKEFGAIEINGGPSVQLPNGIVIKDVIADAFLQQVLLRPTEYDVIATLNLNGDYISDALAAEVGGMGITPGARFSDNLASFETTHGTAPAHAGLDKVNPSSLILAAEMMLRHLGWKEAADLIIKGIEGAISSKVVTCDLARLMDDATEVSCSEFGQHLIERM